jgi:hypothetical protein
VHPLAFVVGLIVLSLPLQGDLESVRSALVAAERPKAAAHLRHVQHETPLPEVLRRAAEYVAEYERDLPAVVSEEHYTQRAGLATGVPQRTRRLRSDLLIIADDVLGWIGFRDVFEVDGKRVRDRDERLADLFLKPNANRLAQARRIAAESSRFNLNIGRYEIQRTINMPLTALRFLRAQNQTRSTFKLEGDKRIDGIETSLVSFEEQAKPRMMASDDDAAAKGRYWIDSAGRVIRTEFTLESAVGTTNSRGLTDQFTVRSIISVSYGQEPRLGLWVPVSMEERYNLSGGVLLSGSATYANFRRFSVDTSTIIKVP